MLSLQEISDRLEIQQLLVDYSTAIDKRVFDDLDNVFTDDGDRNSLSGSDDDGDDSSLNDSSDADDNSFDDGSDSMSDDSSDNSF